MIVQAGNVIEFPESMLEVLQFYVNEAKKNYCQIKAVLVNGSAKKEYRAIYKSPDKAHKSYLRLCVVNRWDHREDDRYGKEKQNAR